MKLRKVLSLLLALVFAVSLVPVLPVSAGAAGESESNPIVCTSYAAFKAAMENPSVLYVKINSLNDTIAEQGSSLIAGAQVTSTKTLILSGNSEITAGQGSGLCRVDSLIYVGNGGNLTVKGTGSLTFKANASNAANAVIHITHDNTNVFLYDGITLNGSANGYAYGRAVDLNNGNLNIWGGTYTGDSNMNLTGPSSALLIIAGNCKITKGQFTAYDHASSPNQCKGIVVPTGKTVSDYLQLNSGYIGSGASTTIFPVFTERPTYTSYTNYGMVHFSLGYAPSDSAYLVAPGQKVENGQYTAIFAGAKPEYNEGIYPNGIYPTPEGQYQVAVKIGDQWYYSTAFTVKYNEDESTHTVTVTNGTATPSEAKAGETVTITYKTSSTLESLMYIFDHWEVVSGGMTLANSNSVTTTFTMPDQDVSIKAVRKDREIQAPLAFTTQPQSGTAKKTEDYTYSWALNETPDSIVSQAWFNGGWHNGGSLMGKTSDTVPYSATIIKYRIKATKGTETIYSTEFTVTWTEDTGEQTNPFVDIKKSDPWYDAVLWAYYADPQVTKGVSDTRFGPTETVTRGQCAAFLWRAMGCPEPTNTVNPFVDVPSSQYYYKPILWAVEKGITQGTSARHFSPNDTLTTAHIITFLYRAKHPGANGWYEEAGAWAEQGYGSGKPFGVNTPVNPKTDCPRGYVVMFLQKAK